MSIKTDKAVNAVRNTLHQECKNMPPTDYKEVLEELEADIEGNLGALKDENPDLFD